MKKNKANPKIVVAAAIEKDGSILIAKRKEGWGHPANWEFPGGTLEEGETHEECLKRELQEELSLTIDVGDHVCTSEYVYTPDWTIRLIVYRATIISGSVILNDHEEIRWVRPKELGRYDFPPANKAVVERLMSDMPVQEIP